MGHSDLPSIPLNCIVYNVSILIFSRSTRGGGLQALWKREDQAAEQSGQRRRRRRLVDRPVASQSVRWQMLAAFQMEAKETLAPRTAVTMLTVRPQRASGPHAPPPPVRATVILPALCPPQPSLHPLCPSPPLPSHHHPLLGTVAL